MDRAAAHFAKVQAGLPAHPPPPASAINPLKARLMQLRTENPTPITQRAIEQCEALIQQLESQNGPRHP